MKGLLDLKIFSFALPDLLLKMYIKVKPTIEFYFVTLQKAFGSSEPEALQEFLVTSQQLLHALPSAERHNVEPRIRALQEQYQVAVLHVFKLNKILMGMIKQTPTYKEFVKKGCGKYML